MNHLHLVQEETKSDCRIVEIQSQRVEVSI